MWLPVQDIQALQITLPGFAEINVKIQLLLKPSLILQAWAVLKYVLKVCLWKIQPTNVFKIASLAMLITTVVIVLQCVLMILSLMVIILTWFASMSAGLDNSVITQPIYVFLNVHRTLTIMEIPIQEDVCFFALKEAMHRMIQENVRKNVQSINMLII